LEFPQKSRNLCGNSAAVAQLLSRPARSQPSHGVLSQRSPLRREGVAGQKKGHLESPYAFGVMQQNCDFDAFQRWKDVESDDTPSDSRGNF